MKKWFCLVVCVCVFSSCVPVIVGGAFYKSSKTKEQRREFTTNFQRTNLDREAKGLKPLDWCSEAYKFDAKWAKKDPQCKMRVEDYEGVPKSTPPLDMGTQSGETQPVKSKNK